MAVTARWVRDYLVCDEIGAGGMARVFVGRTRGDFGFSRTIAVKAIHESHAVDPHFVAMFVDEARIASRIHHPNVVGIIDVVAENGSVFLVLDYVHGETLASLVVRSVRDGIPIPIAVAIAAVRDLLRGLHAAHEAAAEDGTPLGIVHRDVSPQNVIVGADGSARLFDFGVAKAVGRLQTTREGAAKGKLGYMAPEQLKNETVDRRADVYAAAVILWELLAQRRLVGGDSEAQLLANVLCGDIEAPSRFREGVPPALDAVVMRGLARHRDKRFSTAAEMGWALDRAAERADSEAVARVVSSLAADSLARRAALVTRAERCCPPLPTPAGAASLAITPARSRSVVRRWRVAGLAGAITIVALVGARFGCVRESSRPDEVSILTATTPATVPSSSGAAPVVGAVAGEPPSTSLAPSAGARPLAPHKRPSLAATRATATPRPCASVIVDPAGIHRYNRECL